MNDLLKIILAEDDRDDCFLFQEALNRLPYTVSLSVAEDGERLIELLHKTEEPDFIFLDLNMPKKDGFDCLNYLQHKKSFLQTAVIIMSTSSNPESIDLAYSLGADLYVKKPDNFNILVRVIDLCLQRKNDYPEKPSKEDFLLMA